MPLLPALRRPKVVAFDIIETVFSIDPIDDWLAALGLPAGTHRRLYAEALRDSMALATVNGFAPFVAVMRSALMAIAAECGVAVPAAKADEMADVMRRLPPQPDARAAFEMLHDADVRIVALSNGAESATNALLERAGMRPLVEAVLSVEAVKLAKPRAEVYGYAVRAARVQPAEAMLVACHPWDVNGAKAADLRGGYVARGKPYPSSMASPDITGEQLTDVASAVAALPA